MPSSAADGLSWFVCMRMVCSIVESAAIRIVPSTKPTMPIAEKIKLYHPVKRSRSGSSKNAVNSLLISITKMAN